MKTIVIGGGILGLVAAWKLASNGVEVIVLEKDEEPGGLCRGFSLGERTVERYHHFVTAADLQLIRLMKELSLLDSLHWATAKTANLAQEGLIPLNSAFDLLKYPGIPMKEKLRFGFAISLLTRFSDWRAFEKVSIVDWIKQKGGPAIYEILWKRLFETKFGEKADEIPVSWFWARLRRRMSKKVKGQDVFGIVNGSMKIVIDGLVLEIENAGGRVVTGTAVRTIEQKEEIFSVATDQGEKLQAKKVVFTAPLHTLIETVPQLSDQYKERCRSIEYSGIVNAVFELRRPLSKYFWINVTGRDLPFSGIIETTRLFEKTQNHLIYLPQYLPSSHFLFGENEEKILDKYQLALLESFLGLKPDEIVSRHLFRERFADPYYSLNYSQKIVDHKTPIKGLYCFNTTQIYPITRSANSSILFGKKAAKSVMEDS